MKHGRNDPCWCNSGKKYKNCHLNREREKLPTTNDIRLASIESFSQEMCLHPNAPQGCNGPIIKAHSVSRGGNLSKISRNSKVYQVRNKFVEIKNQNGKPKPKLESISSASTFTGFCQLHDLKTFSPIENQPFSGTEEQCMLLGFRALTAEYFWKKSSENNLDTIRNMDKGKGLTEQVRIQREADASSAGIQLAYIDFEAAINKYKTALSTGDYSDIGYYVAYFDKKPSILCSGAFTVVTDIEGGKLQSLGLGLGTLDLMTLSLIVTDQAGAAIFSWSKSRVAVNEKFIESFDKISMNEKADALIRICFEHSDNLYMEPDWWEGLDDSQRLALEKRILSGTIFRMNTDLKDDGMRIAPFKVISAASNFK